MSRVLVFPSIGQSNVGRAESGADPDYVTDVKTLSYVPNEGLLTYEPGVTSVWDAYVGNTSDWDDGGSGPYAWWGSELQYFKNFRADDPDTLLCHVGLSAGGAPLQIGGDEWGWLPSYDGQLFDNMKNWLDTALAAIVSAGHTPVIDHLFISQGEADVSRSHAAYGTNLGAWIDGLRSEWPIGNCPIIVSRLNSKSGTAPQNVSNGQLRQHLLKAGVFLLENNARTTYDGTHYTAASQAAIGNDRYAIRRRTYTPTFV